MPTLSGPCRASKKWYGPCSNFFSDLSSKWQARPSRGFRGHAPQKIFEKWCKSGAFGSVFGGYSIFFFMKKVAWPWPDRPYRPVRPCLWQVTDVTCVVTGDRCEVCCDRWPLWTGTALHCAAQSTTITWPPLTRPWCAGLWYVGGEPGDRCESTSTPTENWRQTRGDVAFFQFCLLFGTLWCFVLLFVALRSKEKIATSSVT